jgi:hypothetical protein
LAQEADVWLYSSDNWSLQTGDFSSVPAYANGEVYDFLGRSGPKDWYESRYAQPDVVLEDFITMFYPDIHLSHQRAWWRNVFSEGETAALLPSSCRDISEPFVLKSDGCFEIENGRQCDSFKAGNVALGTGLGVVLTLACGAGLFYARKMRNPDSAGTQEKYYAT